MGRLFPDTSVSRSDLNSIARGRASPTRRWSLQKRPPCPLRQMGLFWIPAFAGMTKDISEVGVIRFFPRARGK
jgi:hypothetical protein